MVFGKLEPFLADLRQAMGNPKLFANLEQLCIGKPGGLEKVRAAAERIRSIMAARATAA
jgi:hypothetical protein